MGLLGIITTTNKVLFIKNVKNEYRLQGLEYCGVETRCWVETSKRTTNTAVCCAIGG
jgi:hypothetical protein